MVRVLSCFSGIGAFERALDKEGFKYRLTKYCEIDKKASKCYSLIHDVSESENLWDVTKIKPDELEDADLFVFGSPCQDFSVAGLGKGGEEGSGTRSSLLWDAVRIIQTKQPKYVVWENVFNVVGKEHISIYEEYIDELDKLGYTTYIPPKGYLDARDYGIPQSRQRLFAVSILGNHNLFSFERGNRKYKSTDKYRELMDVVDVTDMYERRYNKLKGDTSIPFTEYIKGLRRNREGAFLLGLYAFKQNDRVSDLACENASSATLTCNGLLQGQCGIYDNGVFYAPTPRMGFRLQGFDDSDFDKVEGAVNVGALYAVAGNSICVPVVQSVFRSLAKTQLEGETYFERE